MVTASSAFPTAAGVAGDRVVDTNTIPTGLIQRVDVVQAGGAAVYGSDAIAGVINYVLKDDFQGFTEDLQYGDTTRNDYKRNRLCGSPPGPISPAAAGTSPPTSRMSKHRASLALRQPPDHPAGGPRPGQPAATPR
jgi:hypothetical protein